MLGRREAPTNGWSERSEQESSEVSQSSLEIRIAPAIRIEPVDLGMTKV